MKRDCRIAPIQQTNLTHLWVFCTPAYFLVLKDSHYEKQYTPCLYGSRFNQHQNRLYIDADWENDFTAGEDYIIVECYRKLDPTTYTDIYDDIYLKRYATALIKQQWGANLSKFSGVAMLGGVTMNGETLYTQALEEKNKLEEQIQLTFELPVNYMVG